jgi:type I restriction enzyme M protein
MPKRHRPGTSLPSLFGHIEELVVATSGADTFEVVFGLAAARLTKAEGKSSKARIEAAKRKAPILGVVPAKGASEELLGRVDALLGRALGSSARDRNFGALDSVFESLVPRVAKGDKGQFFTPRNVVELVVHALAPRRGETLVDPACGSGAFLAHAGAGVATHGCDVDLRAVRVARLLALAQGRDPKSIRHGDGLRDRLARASVVATNPPFAGRAPTEGFDVARVVKTPERDVLFLERAIELLEPGGRLGIVLPYNKASAPAFAGMRRWLAERARIFAIVGLARETFLPHTAQRTFVLFAKKRDREAADPREKILFVTSERAGKDSGGNPTGDDDLEAVSKALGAFLAKERFHA